VALQFCAPLMRSRHVLTGSARPPTSPRPPRGRDDGYALVIEQVAAAAPDGELSFYRTLSGAEIDLLVSQGHRRIAIEVKACSSPQIERGFWCALDDVQPDQAWVASPVREPFPLKRGVTVAPPAIICRALT